jgi:hypothetical protein
MEAPRVNEETSYFVSWITLGRPKILVLNQHIDVKPDMTQPNFTKKLANEIKTKKRENQKSKVFLTHH